MKQWTRVSLVLIVLLCGTIACNSSTNRNKKQPAGQGATDKKNPQLASGSAIEKIEEQRAEVDDSLSLSGIRLTPAPLTAGVDLNAEPVLAGPAPEELEFEYRWFVNDRPLEGSEGPTLARDNFRKKQWVFCEARALSGERSGPWLHSKFVRVVNMPPQIEATPMEGFSVPGEVTYPITASDPDGDPLSYELLSPRDQGIVLDPNTGLLTWKIEVETVQRLGATITIQFAVKDDDNGKTSGSITLNLSAQQR